MTSPWRVLWSKKRKRIYYYNVTTKESTWKPPKEVIDGLSKKQDDDGKKVSWAPRPQIRHFSSEDIPAEVGLRVQDNTKFKHPRSLQSACISNNLSPSFPRSILKKPKKLIKWKCPPKADLNPDWKVASGEESKEVGTQKQRDMTVLEAVYPRLTDISPNPHPPGDCFIPTIPTSPMEDEIEDEEKHP